jgi:HEAT repeat protein
MPAPLLDGALIVVAAIWTALSLTIIADRYRFERRSRRSAHLQTRLAYAAFDDDTAERVTATEFQELVLAGLSPMIERSVAEQISERIGSRQLRAIADGTSAADLESRIRALQILVSAQHADGYYALDTCLRSGDRDLAGAAVRMLVRLDNRRSAEILVTALTDGVFIPSRLAAAFDRMSAPRADLLASLLTHGTALVRFWGVRLAGRLQAREWAPRVRELTFDADPLVRRAASESLGTIGEPKDRVVLLTRFLDPVPMVRLHAARAAAMFPSPAVADALAELLGDREWIVRAAARGALQRLGSVGTDALIRTLWDDDRFAANNAAEVLFLTGAMLEAVRRLLATTDNLDVRRLTVRFLQMGGPHLSRALLEQLDPADVRRLRALVREEAASGKVRRS